MKKSFFLALLILLASFSRAQDRTFQLQALAASQSNTHWQPINPPGNTGFNMTIIGVVQFDGVEQFSDQLEVGAFHNGECRGAALTNVVAMNRNFMFLTVYGIAGEEDTFKIYDHATGTELDMATTQTITYVDNGSLGTLPNPYTVNFIPNYFEITATADPSQGGTISGAGIYNPGDNATLTATANAGYTFVNWTRDGVEVSTSATYSFTVTENVSLVAHFSINSYTITASANPSEGGSVSGANTYTYGTECTLTATANTGYTFLNWTKNGSVVSTNPSYTFTVTEAGSYVANFQLNTYSITVTADPTEGGTVSGTGTYNHGATVTLTATPSTYYYFVNWTKDGSVVSTDATYSFTATEGGNYVAHFGINNYHISVLASPMQGGTVTGAGDYNNGTSVTLTATPNSGYDFINWTKNGEEVSTSTSFTIIVTENASYVAHFEANTFEVTATADPSDYGTVTGAGTYNYGATARLRAIPNTGYSFVNWTRDGEVVSTSASYNFTVTESIDLVAHFAISTYNITATASPYQGGSVSGGGTYQHGATVTLTATPNTEYDFVNWTKGVNEVSTDATYTFTATESGNYVAHFSLQTYTITATADPSQGGTIYGAGTYNRGATCTLTATANIGYTFVNWTKDNIEVSTSNTMSFQVNEDASYVAHFSLNSYEITVEANPTIGGTVSGGNTYYHGTTVTLTASPSEGYHFINWTKNGVSVSTNANYSFIAEGAGNYVANFLPYYEITASVNPEEGGSVSGAGSYNQGETCTLVATAATGYTFTNWTHNDTVVSTSATYSFTVSQADSYVANFEVSSYLITVTANPTAGGTVSGGGTYYHGSSATLSAVANTGYNFVNWKKNGVVVSTDATYNFTVTGAGNYVAYFSPISYEITATANPSAGGTIVGAGSYNYGSTCFLTAIPNPGYAFVNWTKNGVQVATTAAYSFTVTQADQYVANFEYYGFEITATAAPEAGGTTTGTGVYDYGASVTLTATANEGYTFTNWTKNGTVVSTETSYTIVVTESCQYIAHFAINNYQITATANPEAGGTVSGAGNYNYGTTVTLTATANEGYTFSHWAKNGVSISEEAVYSFTVTAAGDYVAHFTLNSYGITATANPEAGGTVAGAGTYNHGETCTLTATANEGYTFVNWTKGDVVVADTTVYSFTVTEAATYVAHFSLNNYAISATANPEAGGTVTGAGSYDYGTTATLTATANEGYTFVNWTKDNEVVADTAVYSFTVTEAAAYVANFNIISYEITATTNPVNAGVITGAGTYEHGSTCTLTVTANPGCTFINWTKDGVEVSDTESFSFTVMEAGSYVANFEVEGYAISVSASPEAGGTTTGAGVYIYGTTVDLTATANEGYTFVNWTRDGEEVAITPTFTITVTESASYVANFSLNSYMISATANPEAGGTVTGAGTYNHFETCTLIATANEGYTFVNWTKDGEEVSDAESYSFTVTEAASFVAHFNLNSYGITATANPEDGGTVTGGGTYNHFETCTLTATTNEGYTFVNWTKDGEEVSVTPTFSFTVTEAATYIANFSLNSYVISATANPEAGGTVTGAGTYNHFETCTLVATANEGYTFINWTKNGEEVANTPTFNFTVTEAASYIAHFSLNSYEITATTNPANAGVITGAGTYNHGTTCTLTVTANPGYSFINWTKDGEEVSNTESFSFTVTEAGNYVANFEVIGYEITVTANPEVGGTVTGAGVYVYGATANLTATANEGYTFVNWTKDGEIVATTPAYSITVTESASYVANFSLNSYVISASSNPEAGGTVTGAGTYNHFETCTLTATANEGYTFVNWTKNGEEVSDAESYSFTVTEAASFVAHFSLNSYGITATANPEAGGSVTGGGTYNHFETCTLTATANEGYTFVNWTKDGEEVSVTPTFSFTVTEAATYIANFSLNSYVISATANPEAGGTVTGAGTYNHFETCTLVATANEGYTFINWTKNGEEVANTPTFNFTVTEAASYIAHFSLNSYEITATTNPANAGVITGAGTYNHGTTCTLTVTANPGYSFINWTKDGEEVSNTESFSFTVTEAGNYVANFEVIGYEITVTANPEVGGTVTGAGVYVYGATANLTATANEGYTFVNWTKDGEIVATTPAYSITVTESASYVANFSLNSYVISASSNPEAGGTVTGAGTYNHFETCTLTATANEGYTFVNWTKNGTEVSTSMSYSFTVTEAASYVAHFQINSYEITATANPTTGGTVTGDGTYNYGQSCILTATADEGYTFVNWTKNGQVVSTSPNYSFTVTESAAYVANFSLNSYEITATAYPEGTGTVTGGGTYNHFETCTLTAMPSENYIFVNWSKDGVVVSTNATYSFTVVEAGNYVASFAPNEFQINVSAQPSNGGTVTGAGVYNYGTTATLTATANTGFTFVNWTKDGIEVSTDATYSFTVTEAGSYVAHFVRNNYEITATADPTDGGTITGVGTYSYGSICTLTATANEGYTFVRWTKDGVHVSYNPAFSITVTENATYVAHFVLNQHYITVMADPNEGGMVSGEAAYHYGDYCTVTAFANEGYTFVNWTKDGVQVSTNQTYTFIVTEDATLVGHFALNQYQINATADPTDGGSVTGSGTYNHGEMVTLTATANNGYHFVNWTKNGNQVSTNATYTFTATETADFVAHFEHIIISHEVTTEADPVAGGTTTGDGTYNHGAICHVNAFANEGYTFINWTKNGNVVSTNAFYQFVVNEDTHLVAHFQPNSYQIAASVDPQGSGTISGAGTYTYGQTATLTVIPNENYVFQNWTEDGEVVSEDETYSFEVTGNRNLVAHLLFVDGIDENYNVDINIYPNPASYKLTVETSQVVNMWEIFTTTGSLVYSSDESTDRMEFSVSHLAPGTYLIRMTINDMVVIRKFVKKM